MGAYQNKTRNKQKNNSEVSFKVFILAKSGRVANKMNNNKK